MGVKVASTTDPTTVTPAAVVTAGTDWPRGPICRAVRKMSRAQTTPKPRSMDSLLGVVPRNPATPFGEPALSLERGCGKTLHQEQTGGAEARRVCGQITTH